MDSSLHNMLSLNGKRTLLTGAFGGLGNGIIRLFTKHDQHITATTRRPEDEVPKHENVEVARVDLNNDAEVLEFVKNVDPFDNVILCHGIVGLRVIPMITPDYAQHITKTNFLSKTNLISQLVKRKKILAPGRVVNVSSVSAHYGSKNVSMYASSHAATETFMRSLAKSFLKKDVTVNSIAVNAIWTPLFEGLPDDNPIFDAPLGHGEVGDVANAAYFLCQTGSEYITGETLFLTGGQAVFDD